MAGSLTEYAEKTGNPWRKGCKVCDLDDALRKEVDAGIGRGIYLTIIAEWLRTEHEFEVAPQTLGMHRRRCLS